MNQIYRLVVSADRVSMAQEMLFFCANDEEANKIAERIVRRDSGSYIQSIEREHAPRTRPLIPFGGMFIRVNPLTDAIRAYLQIHNLNAPIEHTICEALEYEANDAGLSFIGNLEPSFLLHALGEDVCQFVAERTSIFEGGGDSDMVFITGEQIDDLISLDMDVILHTTEGGYYCRSASGSPADQIRLHLIL